MILMEGMMLVPPDRGTIIGRALWKAGVFHLCPQSIPANLCLQPRYIVVGSGAHLKTQNNILSSTEMPRSGRKSLKSTSSKPSLADVSEPDHDKLYISIYKQKVWPPL